MSYDTDDLFTYVGVNSRERDVVETTETSKSHKEKIGLYGGRI